MIQHVLRASLERNWIVTIIYMKNGQITQRDIKVLKISGNNIEAFCYLRNQIRIFKMDNILSATYRRKGLNHQHYNIKRAV